jgi:hypothetical protein
MLEVPPPTVPAPRPATPSSGHRTGFHEFLSELNPLQYIPVIGTIYRAVTGDTIPEEARIAGGLVLSGLTAGPIGIATNIALTAAEHVTGVDPEAIGQHVLAEAGIGGGTAPHPMAEPARQPGGVSTKNHASSASACAQPAWSCAQLTAYGVTKDAGGDLHHGAVSGADVLNELELARVTPKLAGAKAQAA